MSEPRYVEPLPLGDSELPYSKGLMTRTLMAAGMPTVKAYELARAIERDLEARRSQTVELPRVEELAVELLGAEEGEEATRLLRRHVALQELDLPIIVLIGGSTGSGKSRVATEIAHRLGISRLTSTDFIRQTMRAFFSEEFMPSIHFSSFEAGQLHDGHADDPVVAGFLDQTRNVLTGVRASLARALTEGLSMVIEGVHLVPGMVPVELPRAVVVHCVLAIEDPADHERHFWAREAVSEGARALQRYMEGFPEIRRIQDFLVTRAEATGVPVIDNTDIFASTREVMELVHRAAERVQPKTTA